MRLNLNHLLSYLNFMTAITLILFQTAANCKLAKNGGSAFLYLIFCVKISKKPVIEIFGEFKRFDYVIRYIAIFITYYMIKLFTDARVCAYMYADRK